VNEAVQPLLILGTGMFALEVADLVSDMPRFRVAGFVENLDPERCREKREGLPVFWVDDIAHLAEDHCAVCSLATTHRRQFIEQVARHGVPFATLVHPTARVSAKSTLGEGTTLSVNAIIASHTRLGRHVRVNRGALIGHHTEIGDYVTIQPGGNISGACQIGEAVYIGSGAIVLDRITIGSHAVVGAGAVVTQDVPENVQVVGVPARIVKENIAGK